MFYNQPKTKQCRPTQIKIGENNKQKEITPQKQEIQECEHTTTHEEPRSIKIQSSGSVESSSGEENKLQQLLFYTNEDLKNYLFINAGTSIPIIICKLTKNCSHIISGISITGRSPYSGND